MTPEAFVAKWSQAQLTERASYQQHFLDLCDLIEHPKPAEVDPTGESFCFEKGASKQGGGEGFADVWKRGCFAFEYKGKHKDLDRAYEQILRYREALENPPLLVVCDIERIIIHTNFTATVKKVYEIPLAAIGEAANLEVLRSLFHHPDRLRPGITSRAITEDAAAKFGELAERMRARGLDAEAIARFLDRVVFCMFAEDIELLPNRIFSKVLERAGSEPPRLARYMGDLFAAMATGGDFMLESIRYFNGDLFTDAPALELQPDEITVIRDAARLDWSAIDASIFGTLFERGLDPAKRAQLGAHYTSREDVELLVEPVVMRPVRQEWNETKEIIDRLLSTGKKKPLPADAPVKPPTGPALKKALAEAYRIKSQFLQRLAQVTVLDPACGSGNFLNVTLQKLKDLEKEVLLYGGKQGLATDFFPQVTPRQLHGIEINRYAYELAEMSLWIGYIQWSRHNGFALTDTPLLKKMTTFQNRDAILDLSDPENPKEPEWPKVDYIVGNPPFLGDKLMRGELGNGYVNELRNVYADRIPGQSDLCCYWFERARAHLKAGKCRRVGLLATQAIRGGANREVLNRIKETGSIFFAISDRDWILDGANVHVSMVGFTCESDVDASRPILDGRQVATINSNLTSAADVAKAVPLPSLANLGFIGVSMHGPFDLEAAEAMQLLRIAGNPNGKPNSDVVRPILNAMEITRREEPRWLLAFEAAQPLDEAALYERPFELVRTRVKPVRDRNHRQSYRERWWLHGEARPAMLAALRGLCRFAATPRVSKHRIFVWVASVVVPSDATVAFASDDDYFLGVLHSRFHEVWALNMGTQLREKESGFRYTPTTCFETFPFPEPTDAQRDAIAQAAAELNGFRERWLNPPEWTREEAVTFPGSIGGPWACYVTDSNAQGIGTVHYTRLVPADDKAAAELKKRTLTNLYNTRPTWLANAHRVLDEAVAAAYGFPPDLPEEEVLGRLLELNLQQGASTTVS